MPFVRVAKRALCVLSLTLGAVFASSLNAQTAPERTWPRAQAVSSARAAAVAIDQALASPTVRILIESIGGERGQAALDELSAHAFSAFSATRAADRAWQRFARSAQRHGASSDYGYALLQRSGIALSEGDYARCRELAGDLLTLGMQTGSPRWTAAAERFLGIVARRRGQLADAIQHQQQVLLIGRDSNDPISIAQALNDLSTIHRDRGDLALALDAALEALQIRLKTGDSVAIAYRNLALLYREIEDIDEARNYFRKALDLAADGNPATYGSVLGPYASLLNESGEHAAALDAASEALAIDTALADPAHQAFEHLEIGRAYFGIRSFDKATAELETALSLGRSLGQREIIARALLHLAEIAMRANEHAVARGRVDEALSILESSRLMPQLAQAYALREQLARAENDYPAALRFAHKHAAEREASLGLRIGRQLAAVEVRNQREHEAQRIELLSKDNQLQAAQIEKQNLQRRDFLLVTTMLVALLLALVWRFHSSILHNRALASSNAKIERQRIALDEANRLLERRAHELHHAAITDSLTGVANRGHALERLGDLVAQSLHSVQDLSLLLIDFDHFKQINDRHGHLFGDSVLVSGVSAMRGCLRDGDLIGRFGGEEFLIALPGSSAAAADTIAERVRDQVSESLQREPGRIAVTISIGIASLSALQGPPSVKALLEAADAALYAAKRAGRDRVRHFA